MITKATGMTAPKAVLPKGGFRKMVEVLVLDPTLGLCWLDGKVHEVRLTLDEPVAQLVRELLRARDGSVFLELALDESGKGRVVTLR
ncbi:MAG: hypothetical protein DIU83_00260 [Bacillota bacterium]|nr:MAG: hypothetical protein DIU83_00260 [Bacillota bacterium]